MTPADIRPAVYVRSCAAQTLDGVMIANAQIVVVRTGIEVNDLFVMDSIMQTTAAALGIDAYGPKTAEALYKLADNTATRGEPFQPPPLGPELARLAVISAPPPPVDQVRARLGIGILLALGACLGWIAYPLVMGGP